MQAQVSRLEFRDAMARVCAPVNIVTTDGPSGRGGFTATAMCSVSDDPPSLLVCMNERSAQTGLFLTNRRFCVNVLTQALGVTAIAQLQVGMAQGRIVPGMGFLLCSDGLTEELDPASIAHTVSRTDLAAQECVDQLLLDALDRGGKDNITAILVRSS